MKKYYFLFANVFCIFWLQVLYAQNITLDASTHNTTVNTCSGYLYDNSISGNYSANQDRHITICPAESVSAGGRTSLTFEQFDIGLGDKVYIYQGESISAPIMTTDDNRPFFQGNDLHGRTLIPSLMMSSGCLTVRLVSDASGSGAGFKAKIECVPLCQHPEAELDSVFYVVANGQMIPHGLRSGVDTVVLENGNTQVVNFKSIDICFGDSIVLAAKPIFPENDNFYHQEADNCIYSWTFGDGFSGTINHSTEIGHRYRGGGERLRLVPYRRGYRKRRMQKQKSAELQGQDFAQSDKEHKPCQHLLRFPNGVFDRIYTGCSNKDRFVCLFEQCKGEIRKYGFHS